jgi:PglZ domain
MRYEMGRDLAEGLQDLGSSAVEPVATVVPTTTPAGMAALMPGAHGAWGLRRKNDSLVPVIGERQLAGSAERVAWLAERLGERYADIVFDDLIHSSVRALEARFAGRDLVVVRTQEIDALGEGGAGGLAARRIMSDVLSWLRQATNKLVQLGFRDFVFCADHGYVLLPEVAAGDVVTEPPGEWLLRKRRSRLGRAAGASPGVVVLSAPSLGIPGDVDDVAVPTGFRVYARDAEFFHEGISLQECLVPLVTLQIRDEPIVTRQGGEHVEVIYKRDQFTSRIVGLKLRLDALLTPEVLVRVEAFDGTGAKAARVGEAADCDARDERTGFIRLRRDEEAQVPLRIEDDFRGRYVEVRVVNADGPEVVFGRLTLKNGMME